MGKTPPTGRGAPRPENRPAALDVGGITHPLRAGSGDTGVSRRNWDGRAAVSHPAMGARMTPVRRPPAMDDAEPRAPAPVPMQRFQRLLTALTLTEKDATVLAWTSLVARLAGARHVTCLHGWDPVEIPAAVRARYPWLLEPGEQELRERMAAEIAQHLAPPAGVAPVLQLRRGPQLGELLHLAEEEQSELQKIFQRAAKATQEKSGIQVSGMDDMVFHFARCCDPLPGDELVGYVTRGRGVAVHTRGCTQTMSFDPQRLVHVGWGSEAKAQRRIKIRVLAMDKIGILAAMSQSIAGVGANIVSANVTSSPDGKAVNIFEISIASAQQLDQVRRALEAIDGVLKVERERKRELPSAS